MTAEIIDFQAARQKAKVVGHESLQEQRASSVREKGRVCEERTQQDEAHPDEIVQKYPSEYYEFARLLGVKPEELKVHTIHCTPV